MNFSNEGSLIYNIKVSSVGPGRLTGQDVVHYPSGLDLAMKLHYLKGIYFFGSQTVEELTVTKIKDSFFDLLNDYYVVCGRFRRSDSGQAFIKCNDCGARMFEARCHKTVDEWLEMRDWAAQSLLVPQQVLGPELQFSPPVLIQVTRFKCGGMSIGLSWAHVLGDWFSVFDFMNRWGQIISGIRPRKPINYSKSGPITEISKTQPTTPQSLYRVDPVGDHWISTHNSKMDTFSFYLTRTQLTLFLSDLSNEKETNQIPIFESICAIVWQCIAKVRNVPHPNIVTLCKRDPNKQKEWWISNYNQTISTVEADFSIKEASLKKIAMLLVNGAVDERDKIEEIVEEDNGVCDFIMYGSKLTFVDLEEVDVYGLRLNGQKPKFVEYSIQGVGNEGVVLVISGPEVSEKHGAVNGKFVTLILPENEVVEMRSELAKNSLIV